MNIVTNEKMIKRNARIAQITTLAGMGALVVGMYFLFTRPEQYSIPWIAVLVGFVLSQIGIYFSNRWGRRPRPDEMINAALKGLGGQHTLYHYTTPTSHLLVGPHGVWVILPQYQRGTITYTKNRFRQKGAGFIHNYLRVFGQEGLGRPDLMAEAEIESVEKKLKKVLPEADMPPVNAAILFTDERAVLEVDEAPYPTMLAKKFKEFIRKSSKTKGLTMERVKEINEVLRGEGTTTKETVEEEEPAAEK
jgi:hypothetical protein